MKQPGLWLVFDLGGVLFDFHGVHGLADVTGRTYDTIHASLKHSPACRLFESGRIGGDEFAALLRGELALEMPPAELLERWVGWLGGLKPGAAELLAEVRGRYHTACLSNTNELHWAGLMTSMGWAGCSSAPSPRTRSATGSPTRKSSPMWPTRWGRRASSISTTTPTSSMARGRSGGTHTKR